MGRSELAMGIYGYIDDFDSREDQNVDKEPTEHEVEVLTPIIETLNECVKLSATRRKRIDICEDAINGYVSASDDDVATLAGVDGTYRRTQAHTRDFEPIADYDNKMLLAKAVYVGKFVRSLSEPRARPNGENKDSIDGAAIIDSFLEYLYTNLHLDRAIAHWINWVAIAFHGIMHVFWDPTKGSPVLRCEECGSTRPLDLVHTSMELTASGKNGAVPCAECAKLFAEYPEATADDIPKMEETREGEVAFQVIDPRLCLTDESITSPEDIKYMFVESYMSLADIEALHPDKANVLFDRIGCDLDPYVSTIKDDKGNNLSTSSQFGLYITYYEMPSPKYKNGRIVSFCGSRIMDEKPNVLGRLMGRLQFFWASGESIPGSMWPSSPVELSIPLQRRLNKHNKNVELHEDLIVKPPVAVTAGIEVDASDFNTPGKIIPLPLAAIAPKQMPPQPIPQYAYMERGVIEESLYEKWFATEHERGMSKTNDSARLVAVLENNAQSVMTTSRTDTNSEYREACKACVLLAMRHYAPDRIWMVSGADKTKQIVNSWNKLGNDARWSLYTSRETALSKMPLARFEQTKDLARTIPMYYTDQITGAFDKKQFAIDACLDTSNLTVGGEAAEYAAASHWPDEIIEAMRNGQELPTRPRMWFEPWIRLQVLKNWLQQNASEYPEHEVAVIENLYFNLAVQTVQNEGPPPPTQVRGMPYRGAAPGPEPASGQNNEQVINTVDKMNEGQVSPTKHES